MTSGSAAPYHHGDLPQTLLRAANEMLAETGSWDFSLREVARRAGVSHNAPYRHFADKDALLAAVGLSGFELLRDWTAVRDPELPAPGQLGEMGRAYIGFGVANPALYRLMFARALPRPGGLPETLRRVVGVAQGALRDVVERGAREGAFALDPADHRAVTAASVGAWALVHGVTMLTIDRVVERETGPLADGMLAERVVGLFVSGLERRRRRGHAG